MKRYNTPHRSRVVKTRMTEEEYAEFAQRLSAYHMSQAEFIRQAITGAAIRPIITVSPVNDELLAAVGKLTAEYGRIGGNLNPVSYTHLDVYKRQIENGKPPTYLVSFKGKDIDVMTEAFREFTAKKLGRDKKPSIRKLLSTLKDKAAALNAQKDKVKKKDREVSL